jgi:ribosomal protein S6--L-glutamate ligase
MKIVVLSRNSKLYSTRRLVEAARAAGDEVRVVDVLGCYMTLSASNPEIHYRGRLLKSPDAVIPRIGASVTYYGTAVLRQFEMQGVYALNSSNAISRSRDKFRALQLLAKQGVDMPATAFGDRPADAADFIELVGPPPHVIKVVQGTQGKGVLLAEDGKVSASIVEAFADLEQNFLLQEYIREARGADLRCFVIGDRVVAAMRRQGRPGEFRSNLHRGGFAEAVKITREERLVALKAAKTIGLEVAGVDLLRSKRGPLIMEVNSSPGLEGIERATGVDVASLIIQHIHAKQKKPRRSHSPATG